MPWYERAVGSLTGRCLMWLRFRALVREDYHEANHCNLALMVGNSNHGAEPCPMPGGGRDALHPVQVGVIRPVQ